MPSGYLVIRMVIHWCGGRAEGHLELSIDLVSSRDIQCQVALGELKIIGPLLRVNSEKPGAVVHVIDGEGPYWV